MHLPEQARGSRPNTITVKRKIKTVSALFFLRLPLLPGGEEHRAAPTGIPSTVVLQEGMQLQRDAVPSKQRAFARRHNLPALVEGTWAHPRFAGAAREGVILLGPAMDAFSLFAHS